MIAVCMPSRGLIHSRTVEALLNQPVADKVKYYFTHDLPIPECFNAVIRQALRDSPDYLLILEEDVVLPEHGLANMRQALNDHDIAYYDYILKDGRNSSAVMSDGVNYISTGCTMFRAEALQKLLPFTAKYQYHSKTRELLQELDEEGQHKIYGYHDEHMSLLIDRYGLRTCKLPLKAKHYKVRAYGEQNVNKGYHDIYECQP